MNNGEYDDHNRHGCNDEQGDGDQREWRFLLGVLYPFPPKKTSDKNSFKENLLELGCFVFDIA